MRKINKRNRMLIISASIIVLLFLAEACQKENLIPSSVEETKRFLIGDWEWKETIIYYRGQEAPSYESPATENKIIHRVFRNNLTYSTIEKTKEINIQTDYKYNVSTEISRVEGANNTSVLASTDILTGDRYLSTFRFKDKNTLIFIGRSPSSEVYFTRK